MKASQFLLLLCCLIIGGNAIAQKSSFPEVAALPEQKQLPDPLVMFDGQRVKTPAQWQKERRPELKALFQHYMYGYLPASQKIHATVGKTVNDFLGGKATMKEIAIDLGKPGAPQINVLMLIPNKMKAPVPAILGINFCGNHTVVADPRVSLNPNWMPEKMCPGIKNNRATEESRGKGIDSTWGIEQAIERGYAVITFYHGDLAPDVPDFSKGVFPYFMQSEHPGPHEWGAVAAWAWGFHRVMDYLVTDRTFDKNRIAAFGHSRNGKAAILAAAMDERIALVFPHQAGCGGTAPSRSTTGESVKAINDRFPHWFNDTFPQFNEQTSRLPFDQHSLVALMAPRPVLFTCAVEDTWSNPAGQFEMLRDAESVYRFLNAGGLDATQMPEVGKLVASRLGYFIRPGKHSTLPEDWKIFLDFADRHLKVTK